MPAGVAFVEQDEHQVAIVVAEAHGWHGGRETSLKIRSASNKIGRKVDVILFLKPVMLVVFSRLYSRVYTKDPIVVKPM